MLAHADNKSSMGDHKSKLHDNLTIDRESGWNLPAKSAPSQQTSLHAGMFSPRAGRAAGTAGGKMPEEGADLVRAGCGR
jgi:hypothetical protein